MKQMISQLYSTAMLLNGVIFIVIAFNDDGHPMLCVGNYLIGVLLLFIGAKDLTSRRDA